MANISTILYAGTDLTANTKRSRTASIAALKDERGLRLVRVCGFFPNEERTMKRNGQTHATKKEHFDFRPSTGTPVVLRVLQTVEATGEVSMKVDIEDAATKTILSSGDNMPPILKQSTHKLFKLVNLWAGRKICFYISPKLKEDVQAVESTAAKEAEAKTRTKRKLSPQVIAARFSRELNKVKREREQEREDNAQRRFARIARDSHRYDGEWSNGEACEEELEQEFLDKKKASRMHDPRFAAPRRSKAKPSLVTA